MGRALRLDDPGHMEDPVLDPMTLLLSGSGGHASGLWGESPCRGPLAKILTTKIRDLEYCQGSRT
jgi:hypothetical protein